LTMPEAWLRGSVEGVPAALMPAAHSLIDAVEDIEDAVEGLRPEQVWLTPGGAASIGFHLKHVSGSIERLLTYARGDSLTAEQLAAISDEREPGDPPHGLDELLSGLRDARDRALDVYRATGIWPHPPALAMLVHLPFLALLALDARRGKSRRRRVRSAS